ncbi:MAG: carbohydrate binding family 9 domain-containing protein [Armatimonadota bacterium]|nr:carbohydrate binding family 9 domain-containing protein [Armatimonadota bacterium]MCX7777616.1 carbohydrate binding family 9 domain-containing protein [Armatimonadota bacterium]MDW8024706.1 carbohydrate binding family 9 domain-containing protein [Armatimonadota bacterium]
MCEDDERHCYRERELSRSKLIALHIAAAIVGLIQISMCIPHERPPFEVVGVNERYELVVPTVNEHPKVDGDLVESVWGISARASGFKQVFPYRGMPASRETTVFVIATKDALHFAFRCAIGKKENMRAYETRYDADMHGDERVTISLDTMHTHERTFEFTVNARGTKSDSRFGNRQWNGNWDAAVVVLENEWVAEISIPYSILTYDPKVKSWGINFWRYISETQELSGWAFHPDRSFDERYMPHIVGMPIRSAGGSANELKLQNKFFTVAKYDADEGGIGNMYGLDGEWVIRTNASLRFVMKPDFSEAEEAFESIDVTYVEQFLPEKREFFVQGGEFFGDVSPTLFYSRRIRRFDAGIKLTGTLRATRFGVLTTHDFKDGKHSVALNINHTPNTTTRLSVGYVDALFGDGQNRGFCAEGRIRFGKQGRFSLSGEYARHFSSEEKRDGDSLGARLRYYDGRWSAFVGYSQVSPNFNPLLGYAPRRDFKQWSFSLSRDFQPRQQSKYRGANIWMRYGFGETFSGAFFNRSYGCGFNITLLNHLNFGMSFNRNKHAEYHIRREPFDDHSLTMWASLGGNRPFRWSGNYTMGRAFDGHYRQHSLSFSWTKPDGSWRILCEWSQRRHQLHGGQRQKVRSIELNLTRILSRDKWFTLRYFHRGGDYRVDNFAMAFRIKRESGEELYLILGDPRASKFRKAFIVKWIFPFAF